MKGDFSRFGSNRKKRYSAVLMQQGRLQLDADWNEHAQIAEHCNTSLFRDLVGRSGTPETPEGNAMTLVKTTNPEGLALAPGAYYIDGLLIENEDQIALKLPDTSEDGIFLYYIDAWTREVNAIEDEDLIDPAVGLETAVRLKTEWKVRHRQIDANEADDLRETCQKGNWPETLTAPWEQPLSTGKLKIDFTEAGIKDNKKSNRLYRIEIHQDDPESSEFFFKWSRDNAFVCAEIVTTDGGDNTYTLKNANAEIQKAFKEAAWIELSVPGSTGMMLDMSKAGNYFDEDDVLHLEITHKEFEDIFKDESKVTIRRWDGVFSSDENKGLLGEELGITFEYSEAADSPFYRNGDYWQILVRDGRIVNWKAGEARQPDGVEHHFAALGFVTIANKAVDQPELLSVKFGPLTNCNLSTDGDANISGNLTVGGKLTVKSAPSSLKDTTVGSNLGAELITGATGCFIEPKNAMELLFFGVTPREINLDSGIAREEYADPLYIDIFSKTKGWTASSDKDWCTVTPIPNLSDGKDGMVEVKVTENDGTDSRSAIVTCSTADGQYTRKVTVTQPRLRAPVISGFIPPETPGGQALTIFGANFSPTAANNIVRLNDILQAEVVAATATQLTVKVPENATPDYNGMITVTVGSKTAISADVFRIWWLY